MAQFYTDFRNDTVGQSPSELSLLFGSGNLDFQIQSGNTLPDSDRSLLIQWVSGSYARSALAVDGFTTSGVTQVRVLGNFKGHTATPGSIVGAFLSGTGTDATRTGYFQWHRRTDYAISEYNNGSDSTLADALNDSITSDTESWYLEIIRDGGLIELRSWRLVGESRPSTPTLSFTDGSPRPVAGSVGVSALLSSSASNSDFIVYEVTAATDGDPLPTGPVTGGPTITDVNTNNEYTPGAANTLNGTNLSTTGGSVSIDGVTQTITNRTATAITFTGVRGGNPYNTDLTLTYTDADSNEVTQTVQQVPAVGFAVTAASPNTTDDASLWTGLVDTSTGDPVTVVDGDQALVTSGPAGVAVEPDGTITADETGDLVVQFWRLSEGVWGSDQTVSFEQVATEVPQFAPVIGTITKESDSATIPFTYPGSDASSFQATTNGVDWVTVTSPISRTGLSASTAYSGQVRAVNSAGTGAAASYNFTTEALPMPSITLEGGTIYLDVGEAYIEPGFSASDPVDGDITGSVTTSTDLNTASEGTYSKTYSVTNSNGATVSETRIIIVSAVGDSWPFSKRISYAAPKTWTWGGRHPKTGMRVRIFK